MPLRRSAKIQTFQSGAPGVVPPRPPLINNPAPPESKHSGEKKLFWGGAGGCAPRARRVILNRSASDSTQRG